MTKASTSTTVSGLAQAVDFIEPTGIDTLYALFCERLRRTPDALAYRWFDAAQSKWCELSWRDVGARVGRWQEAFIAAGLCAGDRVALMLPNSPDWVCADQAALGLGLVVVPLFFNDRAESVAYIIQRSQARMLIIDGRTQWRALSGALQSFAQLRIVLRDGAGIDMAADDRFVLLRDWLPDSGELRHGTGVRDALATIVFTSGTIGRPKGVMLTHGNILWNAWASYRSNTVYGDDLFLSFLPLSHMLERTTGYYLPMMAGAAVAFARSPASLAEDMLSNRPTVLISVPRIYESVYTRIDTQLARGSSMARRLFHAAVVVGWTRFERAQGRAAWRPSLLLWPLLRRWVADKVMARFGGRLRIAVCGGAPLPRQVARRFISLGLSLVQGYGMTELSPVVSGNTLSDNDPESVGRPLCDVELRIGAADELLVRSPGVMTGYLDDVDASARAVDAEGWMHTGDCARLRDGRLYITGRLKEIIVLSNGEKISPVDMELAITSDPLFEQAMIIGEGRPFLSALLVLNRDAWLDYARTHGLDGKDVSCLEDTRVVDAMRARASACLKEFPGYAQVRRVALTLEPWTIENGLLTPTLKLRRAQVMERLRDVQARIYAGY
ncbi:MAG: AMP-dependent synthetase/ligase [Chromatiales bacterium]|jgi:long-chain acyl-CoA synthetase|nr:AMP-dependent synthetase/ligase [Chromatiales bacterium]